jgi:hypothetical protein
MYLLPAPNVSREPDWVLLYRYLSRIGESAVGGIPGIMDEEFLFRDGRAAQ